MRRSLLICVLLLIAGLAQSVKGAAKDAQSKGSYSNIEVTTFDVKQGLDVPDNLTGRLREEVHRRLTNTKKFRRVSEEYIPEESSVPTLKMSGTITEYSSGNRAERYLVGFGAGSAKLVAHVTFTDAQTGQLRFQRDITGKVSKGKYGGSSGKIADQLAQEIVRVIKEHSF